MKHGFILSRVREQLKKANLEAAGVSAIRLIATDTNRNKTRTIYVGNVYSRERHDWLVGRIQLLNGRLDEEFFRVEARYVPVASSLEVENLHTLDNDVPENNRRCRLTRLELLNLNSGDDLVDGLEFYKLFLRSVWRSIVEVDLSMAVDSRFFVRRDIYPMIWTPGYSVPGIGDYKEAVRDDVAYFSDAKNADFTFDQIKVFWRRIGFEQQSTFTEAAKADRIQDILDDVEGRSLTMAESLENQLRDALLI